MEITTAPVLTLAEVARIVDVPLWTLRRLFDAGRLSLQRPLRLGRYRCILAEELDTVRAAVRDRLPVRLTHHAKTTPARC